VKELSWYVARLRAMSLPDIAHRLKAAAGQASRRWDTGRSVPRPAPPADALSPAVEFFDLALVLESLEGGRIDWSRDYRNGRSAPFVFCGDIDYRDFEAVGDSKYTWELNRHQFLVAWALGYRETGDEARAAWVAHIILDWIAANPRHVGINWTSSLELALRILSWGIALDLCRDSPHARRARAEAARSVAEQARYIRRTLSEYSSANNHLMGELVGLLGSAALFPELPDARRYALYARDRILEESRRQNFADGVNREQAIYYHHYVAEYVLTADALFARLGWATMPELRDLARRMLEFVDAVTDDAGEVFDVGDKDDGTVTGLNLGTGVAVYESLLWTGWVAFGDRSMGAHAARIARSHGRPPAPDARTAYWHGSRNEDPPDIDAPARRLFPTGGYFVARDDGLTALFKAAPFGYPSIAAHAHCDQLSLLLKKGGETILGDSGTGVYHTEDRWRRFFKGTLAHNTVAVDGRDQAEYGGPFLWNTHANGLLTLEQESPDRFAVTGSHDGYHRLADPVVHERRVEYRQGLGYRVIDLLAARETHRYSLVWNFGPRVELRGLRDEGDVEPSMWEVCLGDEAVLTLVLHASEPARIRERRGDVSGPAGFASPRYLEWYPVCSLWTEVSGSHCGLHTFLLTTPVGTREEALTAMERWR
jgi:hypothetical protein